MGTTPDAGSLRKSFSQPNELNNSDLKLDIERQGHEWSLGQNGMTLYFSRKEKISLSIECGAEDDLGSTRRTKSKWTSLMDISKVMPTKTVVTVDEYDGKSIIHTSANPSSLISLDSHHFFWFS